MEKNQSAAVETDMDKLTTEMMEHICDNICMHPIRVGQTQDELDDICAECKMGKFVCDILNTYNHSRQASDDIDKMLEEMNALKNHYRKCCLVDYNEGAAVATEECMAIVRKNRTIFLTEQEALEKMKGE